MFCTKPAGWYLINMEVSTVERFYESEEFLTEYDLLHEAVVECQDQPQETLDDFLNSFLTPSQLEAVELVKSGDVDGDESGKRLWAGVNKSLLKHPSVIEKIVELSGLESPQELEETAWKKQAACKGDTRFVSTGPTGHEIIRHKPQLEKICGDCAVRAECSTYAEVRSVEKGFWAGETRTYKKPSKK